MNNYTKSLIDKAISFEDDKRRIKVFIHTEYHNLIEFGLLYAIDHPFYPIPYDQVNDVTLEEVDEKTLKFIIYYWCEDDMDHISIKIPKDVLGNFEKYEAFVESHNKAIIQKNIDDERAALESAQRERESFVKSEVKDCLSIIKGSQEEKLVPTIKTVALLTYRFHNQGMTEEEIVRAVLDSLTEVQPIERTPSGEIIRKSYKLVPHCP